MGCYEKLYCCAALKSLFCPSVPSVTSVFKTKLVLISEN
jgi:hypothetical protein